jgi:peptide/nickel transport system substrate-binding protein
MRALAAIATLFLFSSSIAASPAVAGKDDNTLRVAFAEEILNLDYNYTTKREYIILSDLIDDTLFNVNPENNEFEPALATAYNYVDDTTIDVTLRAGVKFHDGTVMDADDVVYTYNWIIDEQSTAHAKGAIERWLDKAEKLDDLKVRFHLKAPYPLALRDMARRVRIRQENAYVVNGAIDQEATASKLVGLGPYKVVDFEPGQKVVLERFADYYPESTKKPLSLQTIEIRNLPDVGTQQAELMSGGIDWMYNVPLDVAESLGSTPMATHLAGPDLRVSFIVLDAHGYTDPDGPLTKVKVRQALNHAINRPEIASYLMGGTAEALYTACHPAQFGCTQDVARYPYDPKRAKELLAEAGYPDGFPLQLWAYREKPVSEAVAADLAAVGVTVDLRYVKLASLNQARAKREIPAYIGTWGSGGTADTAAIARIHFDEETDRNMSGDAEVAKLVLDAEQTMDEAKRAEFYKQALTIIADQAYWVPMVTYSQNYLVSPGLDFPLRADGLPRLYEASWK